MLVLHKYQTVYQSDLTHSFFKCHLPSMTRYNKLCTLNLKVFLVSTIKQAIHLPYSRIDVLLNINDCCWNLFGKQKAEHRCDRVLTVRHT